MFLASIADADDGLYRTPRSASGISAMMTSALKMIAEVIAESGLCRCMMLSLFSPGNTPANIAGMIAKYFATSLAMENVVSAPRVISSCLPISTISMSLVGLESRSTMFPASLAAEVPVFMATPTSAWASAGASLVPSPVIATSLPPSCSFLISAILSSGVASARKSSTPDSSAMALAVSGLSPVIMTVLMPILRISSNRSEMPSLTMSLSWITPSARAGPLADFSATTSGVPPAAGADPLPDRAGRALAHLPPVGQVDAAHPRLRAELDELRAGQLAFVPLAQAVLVLGQHDDGPAFRRVVRHRRQLRRVGQLGRGDPADRQEVTGLPVPDGDRAGLVQQQRV